MKAPYPFSLNLQKFLSGEDEQDLDVDKIFGKPVSQILADWSCQPHMLEPEEGEKSRPSLFNSNLSFRQVPAGVLLVDGQDKIVGVYLGCDLSLLPEYQGQGLGKELVLERILQDEWSPVWNLDTPAYSIAGRAAHEAAWRHARRELADMEKRIDRLAVTV